MLPWFELFLLAVITKRLDVPLAKVREACLLHRKQTTSNAYWKKWNQLHHGLSGKFHSLMEAMKIGQKRTVSQFGYG